MVPRVTALRVLSMSFPLVCTSCAESVRKSTRSVWINCEKHRGSRMTTTTNFMGGQPTDVHSSWSECGVCCWNVLSVGYCSGWKEGETEWWRLRTFIGSLVGWAVKSQFYSVGFWGDYSGHVPRCSFGRSAARFGMSSIRRSHVWESTPHLLRNYSTSCCTTMLMRLIFFPILAFSLSTTATRSCIQAVLGPN